MLYVMFGEAGLGMEGRVDQPASYFDFNDEQEWFQSELARDIVKDVDKTVYVSGEYFESPVFGGIPPYLLSSGAKTMLLVLNEDVAVSGERFGDNTLKWLLKISEMKDVTITLHHVALFREPYVSEPFVMTSLNSGKVIRTYKEYLDEYRRVEDHEEEEFISHNPEEVKRIRKEHQHRFENMYANKEEEEKIERYLREIGGVFD